jgi:hypothetical protein
LAKGSRKCHVVEWKNCVSISSERKQVYETLSRKVARCSCPRHEADSRARTPSVDRLLIRISTMAASARWKLDAAARAGQRVGGFPSAASYLPLLVRSCY